jgi:hypothetical protein
MAVSVEGGAPNNFDDGRLNSVLSFRVIFFCRAVERLVSLKMAI